MSKSSRFKFGKYGGKSARNQNSANSPWAVYCSVGRHIFCQATSFGLGGPHAVSKALERCRRKPAFGIVNPLDLPLIPLVPVLSAFPLASGPDQRLKAFSHWKTCFCYCSGLRKSSYISIPRRALCGISAASHLHGDSGSARPCRYIYIIAKKAA